LGAPDCSFDMPNRSFSLFEPVQVGRIALANRIAMAPLTRNRAPGAVPTAMMASYYAQRAGAGLIVSEATAISQQGQGYADVPGLYAEEQVEAWKPVTQAVHEAGGKIVCQLWHVGRVSHTSLQPHGGQPVAPSALAANTKTVLIVQGKPLFTQVSEPRALQAYELPDIVHAYVAAARNAVDTAGFDGVEIHAANGYLLDQFLKAGSNLRRDDYGGSVPNRARFALEVVRAVTQAIGADRVGIRLSPVSPANDAFDPDPQPLFDYLVRELAAFDLAYVHLVQGATGGARELPDRPFDYTGLRRAYRAAAGRGAWMVNNGLTRELAEQALTEGADLVSFGRLFIGNPDLAERLRKGKPLAESDRTTWYGGGEQGYTDYPAYHKHGG
jgi:N-ethylmaleimide reductase